MPLRASYSFQRLNSEKEYLQYINQCLNAPQGFIFIPTEMNKTNKIFEEIFRLNAPQGFIFIPTLPQ